MLASLSSTWVADPVCGADFFVTALFLKSWVARFSEPFGLRLYLACSPGVVGMCFAMLGFPSQVPSVLTPSSPSYSSNTVGGVSAVTHSESASKSSLESAHTNGRGAKARGEEQPSVCLSALSHFLGVEEASLMHNTERHSRDTSWLSPKPDNIAGFWAGRMRLRHRFLDLRGPSLRFMILHDYFVL